MKELNELRTQLSKEEMGKIEGGKKVAKTRYSCAIAVDCYDECDPSKYTYHNLLTTTTNIYSENIFGGLTLQSSTTASDGTSVDAI